MKVLLLAPQPFYIERGTPIAVDLILKVLSERGDEIDVVTYHLGEDVAYGHVNLHRTPRVPFLKAIPPGFSWRKVFCDVLLFFRALSLLLKNQYDYVHAVEESVFIALVILKLWKVPYVYDMDSSLAQQMVERYPTMFKPFSRLLYYIEGFAVRHAKAVVPVCDALQVDIARHRPKKVLVLWDVSLVEGERGETPEDLKEQLGIDGLMAMYVGNLEGYQGIDLLLDSFSLVKTKTDRVSLVVIGGKDSDVRKYQERARKLQIDDRVFFLGPKPVKHLAAYLAQADLLVSPRINGKNTPMKIYSYLGSGKPVLATDMPTHTQILDDQVAVLAKAEPDSFAAGMLRLVGDETLRVRLGQAGKQLVEERHNFQGFRVKVNGLYDWLAADVHRRRVSLRPAARSPQELGKAVLPQELRIYYQPIVSLETGKIAGFEALVRWQHPDHGLLSPSEFINMAEQNGQIIPIGQWVLHEACRQMREWNLQFPSVVPLTICVNLSGKQLSQPDLIEQIDQVLEETGLDTQSLILEVADRVIEESVVSASETALQLRARGVQVHVDYFAADSPLSVLNKLPVRKLKIAPGALNGMEGDQTVTEKIQQAVDYARSSGIDVVAVGVETKAQLKRLKALKFEYGQGNLFSEPLDGEAVEELIAANPHLLEEVT